MGQRQCGRINQAFGGALVFFCLFCTTAAASELTIEFPANPIIGDTIEVRSFGYSDPEPPQDQLVTRVMGPVTLGTVCPNNPLTDQSGTTIVDTVVPFGVFSVTSPFTTTADVGEYLVCSWLLVSKKPYLSATSVFSTRQPFLSLTSKAASPSRVKVRQKFSIQFPYEAERQRTFFLRYGPGKSCPATVALADAQFARAKSALRGKFESAINGSGVVNFAHKLSLPGKYVFCGYTQSQASDTTAVAAPAVLLTVAEEKKKKTRKRKRRR